MILIDLNVVLDVVQQREPHYAASAAVLEQVVAGQITGCLPVHAFTTLHYLVQRYQNSVKADSVISWLLKYFQVAGTSHQDLVRAQLLGWTDFEDAVVAIAAETAICTHILTRNVQDFKDSAVQALTPIEYISGS